MTGTSLLSGDLKSLLWEYSRHHGAESPEVLLWRVESMRQSVSESGSVQTLHKTEFQSWRK
jgi:hypothetical protein